MKTFTFNVNKKNTANTSSNNYNNAHAYTDNLILSNLKKTAPYLFTSNGVVDSDYTSEIIIPKKKVINIDLTINRSKKPTLDFSKYTDFIKAVNYLTKRYNSGDTFDFILEDGTPVKMFDDEIQIGYELIPLTNLSKALYEDLKSSVKKTIIDIYVKISK